MYIKAVGKRAHTDCVKADDLGQNFNKIVKNPTVLMKIKVILISIAIISRRTIFPQLVVPWYSDSEAKEGPGCIHGQNYLPSLHSLLINKTAPIFYVRDNE